MTIHQAVKSGDVEQVRLLLKSWPELLEAETDKGLTPLHVAAAGAQTNVLQVLLARKARVQARTKLGWTPLHFAATKGDAPTVALLLAYGAEVNVRTGAADTPLLMAVRGGHAGVVKLLLEHRAEPNVAEKAGGSTALHLAAVRGSPSAVEMLVAAGAKVNALDAYGETPLTAAISAGRDAIAAFLEQHGARQPEGKPLSPIEQSLVDYYRALDRVFQTGSASEKRKMALSMIPTRADMQKLFPKHSATAVKVADELQHEIKAALDQRLEAPADSAAIWKIQPEPPGPYIQYCRQKGLIAPEVPVYTLVVRKKGRKNLADTYCFVNQHWVPLPPLDRILPE
ncbi:MAG: ankyrin repeat domain-containing protein [Verrucomicrobia bacterium]|nr:ankyrin repeat domain-containing protein [Verrucomicrobiota bacterium]